MGIKGNFTQIVGQILKSDTSHTVSFRSGKHFWFLAVSRTELNQSHNSLHTNPVGERAGPSKVQTLLRTQRRLSAPIPDPKGNFLVPSVPSGHRARHAVRGRTLWVSTCTKNWKAVSKSACAPESRGRTNSSASSNQPGGFRSHKPRSGSLFPDPIERKSV